MSSKNSNDARTPDQVTQSLRKGFAWTTTHSKIVLGAIIAFVTIGLGASIASYLSEKKEISQQEKYFLLERAYTDKKASFEEAERAAQAASQDKKAPTPDASKKATGDLTKDYGTVVTDFENFVNENPKTQAAQMAALNLTDLYGEYKNPDAALAILQKVAIRTCAIPQQCSFYRVAWTEQLLLSGWAMNQSRRRRSTSMLISN